MSNPLDELDMMLNNDEAVNHIINMGRIPVGLETTEHVKDVISEAIIDRLQNNVWIKVEDSEQELELFTYLDKYGIRWRNGDYLLCDASRQSQDYPRYIVKKIDNYPLDSNDVNAWLARDTVSPVGVEVIKYVDLISSIKE